jgi:hypothetical protein
MHGGADGSSAPKGERNGNYKHGRYTEEVQGNSPVITRGYSIAAQF